MNRLFTLRFANSRKSFIGWTCVKPNTYNTYLYLFFVRLRLRVQCPNYKTLEVTLEDFILNLLSLKLPESIWCFRDIRTNVITINTA